MARRMIDDDEQASNTMLSHRPTLARVDYTIRAQITTRVFQKNADFLAARRLLRRIAELKVSGASSGSSSGQVADCCPRRAAADSTSRPYKDGACETIGSGQDIVAHQVAQVGARHASPSSAQGKFRRLSSCHLYRTPSIPLLKFGVSRGMLSVVKLGQATSVRRLMQP